LLDFINWKQLLQLGAEYGINGRHTESILQWYMFPHKSFICLFFIPHISVSYIHQKQPSNGTRIYKNPLYVYFVLLHTACIWLNKAETCSWVQILRRVVLEDLLTF